VLGKDPQKQMWKLHDLGVEESDVYFVDSDSSETFLQAREILLAASMVGFDS